MLTLIVARARNGAIGRANGLPWRIPEDLAFFKRTTMGATLIMGRRTWESLGRPLPGRRMVVLSRQPPPPTAGDAAVEWLPSLDAALQRHLVGDRELFVIGGADVYRQAMPLADRILVTEIDAEPDADTFLEAPDPRQWHEVARDEHVAADGTRFAWVDLRRSGPRPPGGRW